MVTENTANCSGCGVCVSICPKRCLELKINSCGFYIPELVNGDACINCNLCERVCAKNISCQTAAPLEVLSVIANNEHVLSTSSSGGLCYELALSALNMGVNVCGCVYDYDHHRAVHKHIVNQADLENTKGSKYIQSFTADAFRHVLNGERWMVFGSPCQIAALSKAATLRNLRDKLILVDFFCHGTPSMLLWKKYIEENGGSAIAKIHFRSKERGWHKFSLRFDYHDGTHYIDDQANMFYRFFFNNLCLTEACYSCSFKAIRSEADIRVGDFWGRKYQDNNQGVSACLVFTEIGKKCLEPLQDTCQIIDEKQDDIMPAQMSSSPCKTRIRKRLLKAFKSNKSLKVIYNTTLFPYRLKCKIRSFLR